jgi:Zinc knuckle
LYSFLKRNFINEKFKEAKFNELQNLSWWTYPQEISRISNKTTPRNMVSFIRYYKMGLEIADITFGSTLNQRNEFFKRIDPKIVNEIHRWMASGNHDPTIDQIYLQAERFESTFMGTKVFEEIAPLTEQNYRSQYRRKQNRYTNNMEIDQLTNDVNNMNIYERHAMEKNDINNMTGSFSGGFKNGTNNNSFGGTFRAKSICFNCGKEGHWAARCPNKQNKRNTRSMTRSRSRDIKGQEKIRQNNQRRNNKKPNDSWKSTDIKPLTSVSSRMKAINRYRGNKNYRPRKRYIQNIEYDNYNQSEDESDQESRYIQNNQYEADDDESDDDQYNRYETDNDESDDDQYDDDIIDDYNYESDNDYDINNVNRNTRDNDSGFYENY